MIRYVVVIGTFLINPMIFHCTFPLSICTCMIISIFSHIITSKNTKKKTYKETLLRKRHRAYAVAY